ncbi:MAG TPA: hypothetical protein VM899_16350 [Rubellimicrobium sp.]|nr:hypothetical protein [Rubellimicrobium sp.]
MPIDAADMLATLGEAQQTVAMAMEAMAGDSGSTSQALADLQAFVADFAFQADTVLVQLLESGEREDLLEVAEALVEFFQAAEASLGERLAAHFG